MSVWSSLFVITEDYFLPKVFEGTLMYPFIYLREVQNYVLLKTKKKKALRVIDNFFINHMVAYLLLGLFDLVVHSLLHFARILISQDSKLKSFQASKGEKRRKHRKTWNRPSSNLEISVEQLANAEKHDTSAECVTISLVVFSFFFFVQLGQWRNRPFHYRQRFTLFFFFFFKFRFLPFLSHSMYLSFVNHVM